MKKILTIAMLLFSMASYAQGNLQFNQVLTYTGSLNNTQQISATIGYYNQQYQTTSFAGITLDFVISLVEFNIVQ